MILLSDRLCAIAGMVSRKMSVADVGCDHAHLSIYLAENGIAEKIIACDINAGPIEKAVENICAAGLTEHIDVRRGDGLAPVKPGEVEAIVIAGMGGKLIGHILTQGREVVDKAVEVILGPQSDVGWVREYLANNDFVITDEKFIIEDGKYYPIIKVIHGHDDDIDEVYLRYGRIPIKNKTLALRHFLLKEEQHLSNLINNLSGREKEGRNKDRIEQLHRDLDICRSALNRIGGDTK